jgi:hypothetical protein
MDQRAINEAVRQCVQRCLADDKPLAALSQFMHRLRTSGWAESDIEIVQNTATRMLSVIYDMGNAEGESQGGD